MKDYLTIIEQGADSISSAQAKQLDLSPAPNIDTTYWFEAFAADVYSVTTNHHQERTFFQSEIKESNPNWLIFVFILCFCLVAFVKGFHRKRLGLLTNALLNWKFGKQIIRYEKLYTHPVNFALTFNFIIAAPLFFALCYKTYSNDAISLINFSLLLSSYLILFGLFKIISYKLSSWIFESTEEMKEYIFQANLIAKFSGIVFIILALLLSYSTINFSLLLWTGIATLLISIGLLVFRGFLIALQKSKDLILIILYLCTLEILPLIIVGKLVLNEL